MTAALAASQRPLVRWAVMGVVGLLILGGVGVVVPKMFARGGVEVINREPGEQLYVAGIQVEDPSKLDLENVRQLVVSTAMDGRLRRFGIAVRKDLIDVRALPETRPEPNSKGSLRVVGRAGCFVNVDGHMAPQATPVSIDIEAGKELGVSVSCPGLPVWSRRVMAVPGQEVEVSSGGDS
jgi:eukaryotic-like serine/threonine-protein kinase